MLSFLSKLREKWFLTLLLMVWVFSPEAFVHAMDVANSGDAAIEGFLELTSMAMKVLNAILVPALLLIGDLMDADLILGGRMEDKMLNLWSLIRNLVNIVFAVFLMGVAIYNVFGIGENEGNFAIKTALPRLIIGLILVNFTFPIGKIIIDVTNVATQVTFSLVGTEIEGDEQESLEQTQNTFQNNVCQRIEEKEDSAPSPSESEPAQAPEKKYVPLSLAVYEKDYLAQAFCAVDDGGEPTGKLKDWVVVDYLSDVNSNNIGLLMAVNMQNLTQLNLLDTKKVNSLETLTSGVIFSVLIYIVLVISYIALAWVLLTRIFVLWGALILSPVMVLFYVIPEIKEWIGLGGDSTSKVIKHLISPVVIGLVLSLGFILLSTWNTVQPSDQNSLGNLTVEAIVSNGLSDYTDFLILIASVVVMWMGVFSASSGTFAESFTGKLKEFGENLGAWAGKQTMNLPIVPFAMSGGDENAKKLSLYGIGKGLSRGAANLNYNVGSDNRMLDLENLLSPQSPEDRQRNFKQISKETLRSLQTIKDAGQQKIQQAAYQDLLSKFIRMVEASDLDVNKKESLKGQLGTLADRTNFQDLHTLYEAELKAVANKSDDAEQYVDLMSQLKDKDIEAQAARGSTAPVGSPPTAPTP